MDGYSNSSHSLTGSLTKLTWNLAEGNIQKPKRMMIGKEAAYNPLVVHRRRREEKRCLCLEEGFGTVRTSLRV